LEVEEARKWIGKDCCIHWDDPQTTSGKGGMEGGVAKVEDGWLVVDWGWGVLVGAITHIHLASEPCPQQ